MSIRLNDAGTDLTYTVKDENNVAQNISTATVMKLTLTKPNGTDVDKTMSFATDGTDGVVKYTLLNGDIDAQGLWEYKVYIEVDATHHWTSPHYTFVVQDDSKTNLVYLLPYLRQRLGDINPLTYRYIDEWLVIALVTAVRALARYWRDKYTVLDFGDISRSTNVTFIAESPPILEYRDENVVILMAAIILLEGSLENSAYDAVSWKDAEISFSNLESYRTRDSMLSRLLAELNSLLISPTKRLSRGYVNSLPGYIGNIQERTTLL